MLHHVGKDELFDQAEHGQVLMAPDLIQRPLLRRCKKGKPLYLRQRLRHERLAKIEPLLASDNVFYSPADPLGGFIGDEADGEAASAIKRSTRGKAAGTAKGGARGTGRARSSK